MTDEENFDVQKCSMWLDFWRAAIYIVKTTQFDIFGIFFII